ncbi:3'(2'),5'-bisphosphate nucleotidase CysQ [Clostridium butyricum]|uniref:3'(2'),5'-bisphosphate nucleotidase CysQ n=1 Tax=Clostridium butyricum TaxID=1492 RepID=UPI0034679E12
MNFDKELEVAKEAAVAAGNVIMDIYNNHEILKIEYKDENMPLTIADKSANSIITKILKEKFPKYAILSEEEKDDTKRLKNDLCFIVDPLDGTKEFIKRNGQFTVNIALSYKHKSVMGVIYVPVTKELYYSELGKGSFLIEANNKKHKLHVNTNAKEKKDLKVVMSNSHSCKEMNYLLKKYNISNYIKVGSSLKGCMIARGQADVYYRFNPTMEWDTAAMQCIVEEAGGIFRQIDDSLMIYNRKNKVNDKGFYIINITESKL